MRENTPTHTSMQRNTQTRIETYKTSETESSPHFQCKDSKKLFIDYSLQLVAVSREHRDTHATTKEYVHMCTNTLLAPLYPKLDLRISEVV